MIETRVEWLIDTDHPAIAGHFPGRPIVPGVVWLGRIHQLAREQLDFPAGASKWQRIRFLHPVVPGRKVVARIRGDAQAFGFSIELASGEVVARGQCRHDPLV